MDSDEETLEKSEKFVKISDNVALKVPIERVAVDDTKYGPQSLEDVQAHVYVLDPKGANITKVGTSNYFLIPEPTISAHQWLLQFKDNVFDVYVNDDTNTVKFVLKKYKKK